MSTPKSQRSQADRPETPVQDVSPPPSGSSPLPTTLNASPETSWQAAFDALAEPVWLMDAECRIRRCNLAARKIYGESLVGRPCWEVVHGTQERVPHCPAADMCQNLRRESADLLIGERRFNCTVDPLFDAAGKLAGAVHVLRDITAETSRRAPAAERMERERQLLRTLVDLAPEFIFVKDTQSRFLLANAALAKAYGRPAVELLARTDADFLTPGLAARCRAAEEKALAGDFLSFEDTLRFPDGQTRTVLTSMAAFRDALGKVCGLVGIGRDITGRKQAEAALIESHERLKKALEVETVGVMFWNVTSGTMTDANDTFLNLMGYTRQEVAAGELTWQKLTPPEYLEASRAELEKFTTTGRVGPYEKEYFRKDGARQWFVFAGSKLDCTTAVEFCVDISARKNAEAALRESEEKFRLLFTTVTDAVLVFDAETRKFVEANDAALRMYGYTREELQRLTAMDLTGEPAASEMSIEQARAGVPYRIPLRYHKKKDGTLFPVEICASTFVLRGRTMFCGIVRDITERRRAEAALHESEARFNLMAASIDDVLYGMDGRTGEFQYVSPAFERQFGYTVDDIARMGGRKAFLSRIILDGQFAFQQRILENLLAQPASPAPKSWESLWRCKDGTVKCIEDRWIPVYAGGRLAGTFGVLIDITERQKTANALRDASRFNQQIITDAREGIIVYGRDLKYQVWNRFMEEQTGFPAAAVLGRQPAEVFPFLRAAGVIKRLKKVLAGGDDAPQEFHYHVAQTGRSGWASDSNSPLRNAQGEIIGVIGVVRDITERKRTDQLLQRANRTLQAIRDCHEAMLRARTEPELLNQICRIIVQTGGERMVWVGYAENDPRKTVRAVAAAGLRKDYVTRAHITWADVPRGRGPMGTAIRTGRVRLCADTLTEPSFAPWRAGARRLGYHSTIALPLLIEGRCIGALSIYAPEADAFDATEQQLLTDLANDLAFGIGTLRLRAERERLENEILKSSEREQERIGRDLHDGLCQVLVGAKFRSVYLQKISAAKLPAAKTEACKLEETLNQAIEQARDLSRGLNPVKVAPGGLMAALQTLADTVDGARGTHCFCQFPEPVKISNHHAAYHLYRIAQEAVQNAIKHARAKNISITLARREDRVALTVKDDGAGVPRVRKRGGMGLNNMQTRARLIGGRLEIRRRQHGGTAVACELAQSSLIQS